MQSFNDYIILIVIGLYLLSLIIEALYWFYLQYKHIDIDTTKL